MAPQHSAARVDGPAARTRSATQRQQQQQLAAADAALPLLLQHESTRLAQLPVACKLLCCSKSLAAVVAGRCAGQLDMPPFASDGEAERAAQWLRKHARLLRSLDLQSNGTAAVDACAAALMAAGPQSLALQSLRLDMLASGTLPLLEQLPASSLTELALLMINADEQPAFVARMSAALGRLTALRSLELFRSVFHGRAAPLPGLSALTQLTSLCFDGPMSGLQHLPPQLLELQLRSFDNGKQQQPLDLGHLAAATALTLLLRVALIEGDALPPNLLRLSVDRTSRWGWRPANLSALTQLTALSLLGPLPNLQQLPPQLLELRLSSFSGERQPLELSGLTALMALTLLCVALIDGNVLPPNLLRLRVDNCMSAQPLLPLVQLQQLEVSFGDGTNIAADQLWQLSRLTALSLHQDHETEPASAAAWPLLPLQRLELRENAILSGRVCQRLAQLSGLTSLALQWCKLLPHASAAQQLAAALRQLSGLQQLQLSGDMWPAMESQGEEAEQARCAAGAQQLLQAVGSLRQLRGLDISHSFQLAAAVPAISLAALTALTSLSLAFCDHRSRVADAAVVAIASQLPQLQSLDCSASEVTYAALPAIGRLKQLTELLLFKLGWNGSEAYVDLHHLSGLTRLERLNVGCTNVADAAVCHLTALTRLRELGITGKARQRKWLQQQLPHLTRLWSGRSRDGDGEDVFK